MTRDLLGLRMRNFQGMIFKWIRTYREIFKSALVYLSGFSKNILPIFVSTFFLDKVTEAGR